jgi:cobalt/nickel transport system permease protein
MIDEPLARGTSIIHALDPRYKLLACLALSLSAVLAETDLAPGLILAMGAGLTLLSRPPWRVVWGRFCVVNAFVLFLWLALPVTAPGTPIGEIWGVGISRQGVRLAWLITLKANAVLCCILPLVATIPAPALGRALASLRVPAKFSFLFVFTYRYLHVIAAEYGRLLTAARLRGFVPATDLRTYRTYAALVAMVLVKSYDRSQRVYQAMLLRGFTGTFPCLDRFRAGRADTVFLSLAVIAAVLAACLDWWGRRGHV